MSYSIDNNHELAGEPVITAYRADKNKDVFKQPPDTIVIHYTAGKDAVSSAKYLADPTVQASAHLVIGRDGTVYQLAPFDKVTWHAGLSSYGGRKGFNQFSIGIELDNAGPLTKEGNKFVSWFKGIYPEDEVYTGVHRNESSPRYWHEFTQQQIDVCEKICLALIAKYRIKDILGHEEISPGRKTDPGPAFPLDRFRQRLLAQRDVDSLPAQPLVVMEDKLNIREGAGVNFPPVAKPLPQGQKVVVLEEHNGWYKVKTEITGWVNKGYLGQ
ncbi:MAG TPA: N-acetylmuramoyl-L-alanine amidase [Chryseosolibacter sp.]|nr:N-acetylmuramoyl-L-alanine amidase [Chryseosolibacter sp.]